MSARRGWPLAQANALPRAADVTRTARRTRRALRRQLALLPSPELRTDLLFVAITILAVLGVVSFAVFGRLERWVTRGQEAKAII